MGTKNVSGFKKVFDQDSGLHKLLTYGVAALLLVLCAFLSGSSEEPNPAWGTIILAFLFYYAIISRRILETIILGSAMGAVLLYSAPYVFDGMIELMYINFMSEDYAWLALNCAMMNIFVWLLNRSGATHAFSDLIRKFAKDAKRLNLVTWLMQFPMFFDDYMHITVLGNVLAPIYDEKKVPREEGAFIIQTTAEPIRVLFPFTGWTAFMVGILMLDGFAEDSSSALMAFIKTIPFSFYSWVAILGSLLFSLGKLPKLGGLKNPHPELYKEVEGVEEEDGSAKKGTLFDFFLPILVLVGLTIYYEFDLVPACIIVLPLLYVYYMARGFIKTKDIEESMVEGTKEFVYLYILILFTYMLSTVLDEIGYTEYLVEVAQQFANPHILPFALFVVFCISEAAMSLNWGLLMIAFPIIIPLAQAIGANPYLCAAAMISAGAFGNNFCYICDFTTLTSTSIGLPSGYQARNCLNYSLIFAGVSAVLYLVCGFVF